MVFYGVSGLKTGQDALSWTKKLEEICIYISAVAENGLNGLV